MAQKQILKNYPNVDHDITYDINETKANIQKVNAKQYTITRNYFYLTHCLQKTVRLIIKVQSIFMTM